MAKSKGETTTERSGDLRTYETEFTDRKGEPQTETVEATSLGALIADATEQGLTVTSARDVTGAKE